MTEILIISLGILLGIFAGVCFGYGWRMAERHAIKHIRVLKARYARDPDGYEAVEALETMRWWLDPHPERSDAAE